jgi:hypothetical protein
VHTGTRITQTNLTTIQTPTHPHDSPVSRYSGVESVLESGKVLESGFHTHTRVHDKARLFFKFGTHRAPYLIPAVQKRNFRNHSPGRTGEEFGADVVSHAYL